MLNNSNLFTIITKFITVIQKHGGIVFGETVRDIIRRNYISSLFKETIQELNGTISQEEFFNDEKYLPEFIDRLLLPEQINCFFTKDKVNKFLYHIHSTLEFASKTIDKIFIHSNGNLYLKILEIQMLIGDFIINPKIKVNLVYGEYVDNIIPPLKKLDFYCDSLYLTTDNNLCLLPYLIPHLSTNYNFLENDNLKNKIIKDIYKKKAKISVLSKIKNIDEMIGKGWSIQFDLTNNIEKIERKMNETNEICPLCIEDININEIMYIRNCCTSSIYHWDCWKNYYKSNIQESKFCLLCRTHINFNNTEIC